MEEYKDFNNENIVNDLNFLLLNIPSDITPLEKVRWLYLKTGMLFSYDYRVAIDENYALKPLDFENNFINRYQTCTQISEVFNIMLSQVDPSIKANVIKRINGRGNFTIEHEANEIILDTGEKFILDLTLDLVNIQSGCRTTQFGFTAGFDNDYDIISLRECREMDKKLGFLKGEKYRDEEFIEAAKDVKVDDSIDHKLSILSNYLLPFKGYHEAKQYVGKLFNEFLKCEYKEFNLTYSNSNTPEMMSCYVISDDKEEVWVAYNKYYGLVRTSKEKIETMLQNGWSSNSKTLQTITMPGYRL